MCYMSPAVCSRRRLWYVVEKGSGTLSRDRVRSASMHAVSHATLLAISNSTILGMHTNMCGPYDLQVLAEIVCLAGRLRARMLLRTTISSQRATAGSWPAAACARHADLGASPPGSRCPCRLTCVARFRGVMPAGVKFDKLQVRYAAASPGHQPVQGEVRVKRGCRASCMPCCRLPGAATTSPLPLRPCECSCVLLCCLFVHASGSASACACACGQGASERRFHSLGPCPVRLPLQ